MLHHGDLEAGLRGARGQALTQPLEAEAFSSWWQDGKSETKHEGELSVLWRLGDGEATRVDMRCLKEQSEASGWQPARKQGLQSCNRRK